MVVVRDRLVAVLAERGMAIGELAAAMGVSRQALHRWMSGRRPWPADRVTQAAVLLGIDRAEITEG